MREIRNKILHLCPTFYVKLFLFRHLKTSLIPIRSVSLLSSVKKKIKEKIREKNKVCDRNNENAHKTFKVQEHTGARWLICHLHGYKDSEIQQPEG